MQKIMYICWIVYILTISHRLIRLPTHIPRTSIQSIFHPNQIIHSHSSNNRKKNPTPLMPRKPHTNPNLYFHSNVCDAATLTAVWFSGYICCCGCICTRVFTTHTRTRRKYSCTLSRRRTAHCGALSLVYQRPCTMHTYTYTFQTLASIGLRVWLRKINTTAMEKTSENMVHNSKHVICVQYIYISCIIHSNGGEHLRI